MFFNLVLSIICIGYILMFLWSGLIYGYYGLKSWSWFWFLIGLLVLAYQVDEVYLLV